MPWKETDKMEQKELFIKAMLANEKPFKHLCADFGISEKTGHKWKNRFYEQGKAGLYEQSRARLTQDMIDGDTAAELIRIKNAHLAWGPKKIREIYAKAYPQKDVPSLSSVKRILDKAGLVKPRKIRPPVSSDCPRLQQQIQAQAANDVWSIDFKGWWKSDGEICEPFTVRDRYSRKILCTKLMQSKSSVAVRAVMTDLFKTYGLPKVIHSDNGAPFAAPNGILNLTTLAVWWITLGILPDRSLKGHPEQNGSLERMHKDIADEIEGKVPGGISANQAVLDEWVKEYNSVRPNEAIGMKRRMNSLHKIRTEIPAIMTNSNIRSAFLSEGNGGGEIILNGVRITTVMLFRELACRLKPLDDGHSFLVFIADFRSVRLTSILLFLSS